MIKEHVKIILSTILGIIATFCKAYGTIIAFVCFAIIFDVVSGVVASKASGIKITSAKAHKGFWKKVGLLLGLFFGIFLDMFIPSSLSIINISIPFNMPFGLIFGCYIVFNECISICENIYRINPTILPRWIVSILNGGIEKIDNLVDNNKEVHDDEKENN